MLFTAATFKNLINKVVECFDHFFLSVSPYDLHAVARTIRANLFTYYFPVVNE